MNELQQLVDAFPWTYSQYLADEKVFEAKLKEQGWTNIIFYNLDADSFGPLVRGISASKGDERHGASYG